MIRQPRAYLAGPDVFLPDPSEMARRKKNLCAEFGIEGVFPLDASLDLSGLSKKEQGYKISNENENLIKTCDLVIANLTPFRGPSADVGTVFEIGFARGLGLTIFGYTNISATFENRTVAMLKISMMRGEYPPRDSNNMHIESYDLHDNLMIDGAIIHSGGKIYISDVSAEELFTDLSAFKECLFAASNLFSTLAQINLD